MNDSRSYYKSQVGFFCPTRTRTETAFGRRTLRLSRAYPYPSRCQPRTNPPRPSRRPRGTREGGRAFAAVTCARGRRGTRVRGGKAFYGKCRNNRPSHHDCITLYLQTQQSGHSRWHHTPAGFSPHHHARVFPRWRFPSSPPCASTRSSACSSPSVRRVSHRSRGKEYLRRLVVIFPAFCGPSPPEALKPGSSEEFDTETAQPSQSVLTDVEHASLDIDANP